MCFIPGIEDSVNIQKSSSVTHHINRIKDKYIVVSIDSEKIFDKIPWKTLSKLELEGNSLNLIKGISKNLQPTRYIKLKYWTLFPDTQTEPDKNVQNCHFFQICVSGLSLYNVAREMNKRHNVSTEKWKAHLKIIIVYIKYSKQSINY